MALEYKKVYLSFGNFDKMVVADCYANGQHACPAVMMGYASKDAFGSYVFRQSSEALSVRFVVNNLKSTEKKDTLTDAYYTVIKHICENCDFNKRNRTR